jgi:hypothetical protein
MAPPTPTPPATPTPVPHGPWPKRSAKSSMTAEQLRRARGRTQAERSLGPARRPARPAHLVTLGARWRGCWPSSPISPLPLTILVTRYYLLPHIDDWRPAHRVDGRQRALHAPVTIAAIEADWQGLHPRLLLRDVAIKGADGSTTLALGRVDAVLSWTSLLALQPRMHSLVDSRRRRFQIKRLRDHRFDVAGFLIDPQSAQTDTTVSGLGPGPGTHQRAQCPRALCRRARRARTNAPRIRRSGRPSSSAPPGPSANSAHGASRCATARLRSIDADVATTPADPMSVAV